jgi:hypothetical protein
MEAVLQGFGGVGRSCTWQDILNARGYVIIVPTSRAEQEQIEIAVPIPFTVTSGGLGNLAPGLLLPIMETTFADFLEQAKMYPDTAIWCGETDRYYRCIAE